MQNVIWIVSDSLRKKNLGCYGNDWMHTPTIDEFAKKAVRFDRHYIASFPTPQTRADHFTGRWSGAFMRGPFPTGQVTLAQLLNRGNIHTAAVVDTPFYLRRDFNLDRGFKTMIETWGQEDYIHYDGLDDSRRSWRYESDRFTAQTFTKAMRWLEQHYEEQFFLYVDVWDPHEPWDAPDYYTELYYPGYDGETITPIYGHWQQMPGYTEEKVKKAYATYCGEITMVDTWLGYFLRQVENMNLMENTTIIFTTDHGFYFGEHGGIFGKMVRTKPDATPYWKVAKDVGAWTRCPKFEEIAGIPLLIYAPGIKPGSYRGLTSAIDMMPTVMDLLKQPIPDWVEGNSLIPALNDRNTRGRPYVVSAGDFEEQERRSPDMTITTDEWSLLYYTRGDSWLYNLKNDPAQEKNIISQHPDVAREVHNYLIEFMKEKNVPEQYQVTRRVLKL